MTDIEMAKTIAEKVALAGGRAYFVGGYVRDLLLSKKNHDIDIEIHGVTPETLEKILDETSPYSEMGVSFGIYSLKGYDIELSFPKNADNSPAPFLEMQDAAKRRDFTVNSMMMDIITGEVFDFFCGRDDIESKLIRHTSEECFIKDPIRVFRCARFSAQLGFEISYETVELCKKQDTQDCFPERIELELKKALLNCEKPSLFFEALRRTNQLDVWFPELCSLIGVEQSPEHHSEGDVWNHTMMVIDEGAKYKNFTLSPFGFMLSCVAHDFGKAVCTENIDGKIHAYSHETKGLPLIKTFLSRFTKDTKLKKYVLNLCEYHMKPNVLAGVNASVKSTNKLFDSIIDAEAIIYFAKADTDGKISTYSPCDNTPFLKERLSVYREYMSRPYVTGKELIEAGLVPDETFTEILGYSHKLRLSGVDKESNLKQTLAYARTVKKNKR